MISKIHKNCLEKLLNLKFLLRGVNCVNYFNCLNNFLNRDDNFFKKKGKLLISIVYSFIKVKKSKIVLKNY